MIGILDFDAYLGCACGFVEFMQDESHSALVGLARHGAEVDFRDVANFEQRQVLLGDIGDDPNRRQIGKAENGFAHFHHHALDHHFIHDDAGSRRRIIKRCYRLLATFGFGDHCFGHFEHFQFLLRADDAFDAGCADVDQCAQQLRAVDPEHRLAGSYVAAGLVDVELFYESIGAQRNHALRALIRFGDAGSANWPRHRHHARFFAAYARALNFVETDFETFAAFVLALIDRDVVHPHLIFLRLRRSVRQAHRVAVKDNLSRRFCSRTVAVGVCGRSWCLRHRRHVGFVFAKTKAS